MKKFNIKSFFVGFITYFIISTLLELVTGNNLVDLILQLINKLF